MLENALLRFWQLHEVYQFIKLLEALNVVLFQKLDGMLQSQVLG